MGKKVKLCVLSEAPAAETVCEMTAGGRKLCVARIGGELYAMDNDCPHRLGPLGEGVVEDGRVLCPWHAWAFEPGTGECAEAAGVRVRTYPVHVDGENILVEMDEAV